MRLTCFLYISVLSRVLEKYFFSVTIGNEHLAIALLILVFCFISSRDVYPATGSGRRRKNRNHQIVFKLSFLDYWNR